MDTKADSNTSRTASADPNGSARSRRTHTEGPWRLRLIDSGMCNGIPIGATVLPPEPFTGPPIAEVGSSMANARLIAAAPELLKSLREMVDTAVRLGLTRGDDSDERWADALLAHFDALKQAQNAIAKAEGRV